MNRLNLSISEFILTEHFLYLDTMLEKQRIQAIFHDITKDDTTNCLGKNNLQLFTITCITDIINKAEPIQYKYSSSSNFFKALVQLLAYAEIYIATD
jgi:hypothetical protein